jgi:hypothetical protein
VLVPLCGKTVDMPYMAARGATVVGVEAVPRPVAEFSAESAGGTQPSTKAVGEFTAHFTSDVAVEIWCAHVFIYGHFHVSSSAGRPLFAKWRQTSSSAERQRLDLPSLNCRLGDIFQLEAGTAGMFSAVWDRGALGMCFIRPCDFDQKTD